MSAPYIIPFNHQPVSTVVSASGTYTVGAGKYARVSIDNAVLPVLNSVNMYNTVTVSSDAVAGAGNANVSKAYEFYGNMDSVSVINTSNAGGTWHLAMNSPVASATSYSNTSAATGTITQTRKMSGFICASMNVTSQGYTTSFSISYSSSVAEIWLKAGDVLTYTSGTIFYEEYNVIS